MKKAFSEKTNACSSAQRSQDKGTGLSIMEGIGGWTGAGTSHSPYYTVPTDSPCSWHIPRRGIVGAVACPCPGRPISHLTLLALTSYPTPIITDPHPAPHVYHRQPVP